MGVATRETRPMGARETVSTALYSVADRKKTLRSRTGDPRWTNDGTAVGVRNLSRILTRVEQPSAESGSQIERKKLLEPRNEIVTRA